MRKPKYILLFISISAHLLIGTFIFAQQGKIDSLLSLLKKDKEDTNKVNRLNRLSWEYRNISSYDSSIAFAETALKLSQQFNPPYIKGIAYAYGTIGIVYKDQGDYPKALEYDFRALKTFEELKDKDRISASLGRIGIVYDLQEDFPKALDYDFKALKIAEELGNKKLILAWLGNIGEIFREQRDYPKALDY